MKTVNIVRIQVLKKKDSFPVQCISIAHKKFQWESSSPAEFLGQKVFLIILFI